MPEAAAQVETKPVVPFLKMPAGEAPYLGGVKCGNCGAIFATAKRQACASCGERQKLEPVKLADTGTLYNYTIVQRSFPGIKVPFISAIIKLADGAFLKGNLLDVNPVPDVIKFDMPLKVVIRDAGAKDRAGNSYLSYFFVPA